MMKAPVTYRHCLGALNAHEMVDEELSGFPQAWVMWRKEGESSFRRCDQQPRDPVPMLSDFCAVCAADLLFSRLRLPLEELARAEYFSVAHDSTVDEPSFGAVLVLNLSYLRPRRPLLSLFYLGLSRWFRFHDEIWQYFVVSAPYC